MKYVPITVQHPPIEPGNDGAIDEFERLLNEGIHDWMNRKKLTAKKASQQLCVTLLGLLQRKAASLITAEAIAKTHSDGNAAERRKPVRDICDRPSDSLTLDLIFMSGLSHRGRSANMPAVMDGFTRCTDLAARKGKSLLNLKERNFLWN